MLNICTFQEYWGNYRKFISQNKEFKFWHLQNFIKEKPYQPKNFDVVFNEARGINRTIIRLVWNGAGDIFLFTQLDTRCVKKPI